MKTFISMVLTTFLFFTLSPAISAHEHNHGHEMHQSSLTQTDAEYACPMHKDVTGKKGDSCPKCGMFLEQTKSHEKCCDNCPNKAESKGKCCDNCPNKAESKGKCCDNCPNKAESKGKCCDNCPNKAESKGKCCDNCPNKAESKGKCCDNCPNKAESKGKCCDNCPNKTSKAHSHESAHTHACPMNPAITGKAGDTCPKCGMDLQPIAKQTTDHQHH
ncbi:heavy metal-binding domain-containing protein [Shewanella sp. TC10]|uniref:heavy metal-binding domain-containing protein n=1 Tax=Shewanella sp. TC10 TaxID=1419739 RepID=UPI00129D5A12|nr:heavy metal-binding domain-containing protein [Shewanella sp. TC10]